MLLGSSAALAVAVVLCLTVLRAPQGHIGSLLYVVLWPLQSMGQPDVHPPDVQPPAVMSPAACRGPQFITSQRQLVPLVQVFECALAAGKACKASGEGQLC